jgi:hypothetical protein
MLMLQKKTYVAESLDMGHYFGILGATIDAILMKYDEERY